MSFAFVVVALMWSSITTRSILYLPKSHDLCEHWQSSHFRSLFNSIPWHEANRKKNNHFQHIGKLAIVVLCCCWIALNAFMGLALTVCLFCYFFPSVFYYFRFHRRRIVCVRNEQIDSTHGHEQLPKERTRKKIIIVIVNVNKWMYRKQLRILKTTKNMMMRRWRRRRNRQCLNL